ncbi:hypothetical protein BDP67DRAFT_407174, partial [Colletotrichum lupini]
LLLLCETFFDKTRPTNQGMVKQWQAESAIGDMSKGFVLVHETQHMLIATGAGERADDLKNPFFGFLDDRSEDCYSATWQGISGLEMNHLRDQSINSYNV